MQPWGIRTETNPLLVAPTTPRMCACIALCGRVHLHHPTKNFVVSNMIQPAPSHAPRSGDARTYTSPPCELQDTSIVDTSYAYKHAVEVESPLSTKQQCNIKPQKKEERRRPNNFKGSTIRETSSRKNTRDKHKTPCAPEKLSPYAAHLHPSRHLSPLKRSPPHPAENGTQPTLK